MFRFFSLFIMFCIVFNIELNAQCGNRYQNDILFNVHVKKDIQYGEALTSTGKNQKLYLDFYEPENDTVTMRPILIFLHGGSFLDGNKNLVETTVICRNVAQRGYTVAAVNYRSEDNYLALVFSELMFKATIRATQDARAAIRYFYKQAKEDGNPLRIDTNQIFLGGLSAGAITALQTAYLDDISEADFLVTRFINDLGGLEGASGHDGYSTQIKGVVNIAGCMLDKNYLNNNKNLPLLNIQYENDILLPTFYGRPYHIFTLPVMMGSRVIAKQMDQVGIYNMNYWVPGRGHVPFKKDGKFEQSLLDSTVNHITNFLFSLLECNPARVNLGKIEPKELNELSIYPNPTNGIMILGEQKFDISEIQYLRIIDLMGKKVYEEKVSAYNYVFDVSHLSIKNNLYIVEVLDKNHQVLALQKIFILN